jgi:two-component system chemotaxis response regulator CheY
MIIDRYMPVMTGPEAVGVIRSCEDFKTLKILMLTGESVMKEIEEAFDTGVDGYMLKPFRVENLLQKVERSLCAGRA